MQDRKRRLVLNSFFSLLSWLAPVCLGLIVTPIVLSRLGHEAYGVYLVLLGFISYSFGFNIGRTVAKYVSEFRSTGEDDKINDAISSVFLLNLAIGLLGASAIAVGARWIVSDLLQVSPEFRETAVLALILGGFAIPATLISQVFQNVLQGLHQFGKVSLLTNLNWLLLNVGNLVLVVSDFGLTGLLAWNLATAAIVGIISFVLVRRQDRNYVPGIGITRKMFASVAAYGSGIFFYQLFGVVLLLFERAWLLRNLGAAESAYYLLPMTLALFMHALISSLSLATFPVVNELLTDRTRLTALYQKATKISLLVTGFTVALAISSGQVFLKLWVGADFSENGYTNLIFHFLTFGLISVMIIIWQINEAHRAARINAFQVFVWCAVSIPLMITTSNIWLAEGVAASRFAGVLITVPLIFFSEKKFLGRIFWAFWISTVVKVAIAMISLAGVETLVLRGLDSTWLSFLIASGAGTIAFGIVALLLGIVSIDEREALIGFFRRRIASDG